MLSALRFVPRSDRSAMTVYSQRAAALFCAGIHWAQRRSQVRCSGFGGCQLITWYREWGSGWRGSDDRRDHVAGGNDALTHPTSGQQQATEDEEDDQRDDGPAVGMGELVHQTEHERPEPARASFHRLVQAEELGLAPAGDQLAVYRAGESLAAP